MQEYGIDGHLLIAIKSLYCHPEVCVCVNGKQSKSFHIVLVFGKGVFCYPPFHNLREIDGQAQLNR